MGILANFLTKNSAHYMDSLTGDKGDNFADNKFLQKYQEQIDKAEKQLDKGKIADIKSLYSERYILDKDIGQPTGKTPEGWTGLYTRRQMQESGMPTNRMNVSSADIHSTAIGRMRYNPKSENLYITFANGNGKEYLFPSVEKEVIHKMMKAPSKGEFYNTVIKSYAVPKDEALAIKKEWKNK